MSKETVNQATLEQIRTDILVNNICPDLAKSATNLVMGSGSASAKIVFVGEAPGKQEDLQGVPFVGASGKLLDQLLQSIDMKREDVYITNIVKYRPPENRDPSSAEKQAFWPYLVRQLGVIQPKLVVTLGRHSMEPFVPKAQIGEVHGQVQQVDVSGQSLLVLPLYHPAAAMYNGSLRDTLFEDFENILRIIKS